ncbi:uncharacterized protein LOC120627553 [Pararge aegeria]|uniref:Jg11399 protein n=1 Tax=Pararge aegeria aegeria TaxID=348720 RepID=A0A8S4RHD6_9NEOP|nr:uncharacterized protein LOC120627553 [Pararge aegeria]CAH2235740.1 jg11399 [Pararge aegeria aegeria]
MGIKLLILLGLLIGVLYGLHILAQDYQAITAPKLLRLLFKRDLSTITNYKATVRWRKILQYDAIQCARLLYCDLGAHLPDNEFRRGFTYMLAVDTKKEDKAALEEFKTAYFHGRALHDNPELCSEEYPTCPFKAALLFDLLHYLLHRKL